MATPFITHCTTWCRTLTHNSIVLQNRATVAPQRLGVVDEPRGARSGYKGPTEVVLWHQATDTACSDASGADTVCPIARARHHRRGGTTLVRATGERWRSCLAPWGPDLDACRRPACSLCYFFHYDCKNTVFSNHVANSAI